MNVQAEVDRIMAIKNKGKRRRLLKDFAKVVHRARLAVEVASKRADTITRSERTR